MKITKDLLKEWRACSDGYSWFVRTFPQGGDVHEVGVALRAEKRYDDASWLTSNVFASFLKTPEAIADYVKSDVAGALKEVEGSPNSASGDSSMAASSGDSSMAASSGYSSMAASSGDYSMAASSGYSSTAASSGDYSTAEASGEKTVAMVAGRGGKARAGEKGSFALAWLDGEQMRIAVGTVGENDIKADTWYRVGDAGQLVEVAS